VVGQSIARSHQCTGFQSSNGLKFDTKCTFVGNLQQGVDARGQWFPHDEKDFLVVQAGIGEGKMWAYKKGGESNPNKQPEKRNKVKPNNGSSRRSCFQAYASPSSPSCSSGMTISTLEEDNLLRSVPNWRKRKEKRSYSLMDL